MTRTTLILMVVVGIGLPALAEEPAAPAALRMAEKHASLAAGAKQLPEVRMHLRHVLDCLEGAKGQDYDAAKGDPCQGKGALQSLPAGSADEVRVQKAIEVARAGVALDDFKRAHDSARKLQAVLEKASPAGTGAAQ